MAKLDLVFGQKKRGKVGTITFDAILSESHQGGNSVTEHAVEEGSNISDHIHRNNLELSLEGVISNHPAVLLASRNAPSPKDGDAGVVEDRVETAYQELVRLSDAGELVSVVTGLKTYSNMAITSHGVTRDASSGNILQVSLQLRQVVTVRTEKRRALTRTADPSAQPKDAPRKPPKKQGAKAKQPATQAAIDKSALFSLFGG